MPHLINFSPLLVVMLLINKLSLYILVGSTNLVHEGLLAHNRFLDLLDVGLLLLGIQLELLHVVSV